MGRKRSKNATYQRRWRKRNRSKLREERLFKKLTLEFVARKIEQARNQYQRRVQIRFRNRAKRIDSYFQEFSFISLWKERGKVCQVCNEEIQLTETHWHHLDPLRNRGETVPENLMMLHQECHIRIELSERWSEKQIKRLQEKDLEEYQGVNVEEFLLFPPDEDKELIFALVDQPWNCWNVTVPSIKGVYSNGVLGWHRKQKFVGHLYLRKRPWKRVYEQKGFYWEEDQKELARIGKVFGWSEYRYAS